MKKVYFFVISIFFILLIYEHNFMGVAYNPLFHSEDGNTVNETSMPCGLGGAHKHKH